MSYDRSMAEANGARTVMVSFRVSAELAEQMRRAAEADNRPLSNWVETVCKKALAEQDETG